MKLSDFQKNITGEVMGFVKEGYTFDIMNFKGSYSDTVGGVTALRKGNERVVLWVAKDSKNEIYGDYCWYDVYTLRVARFAATDEDIDRYYNRPSKWNKYAKTLITGYALSGWKDFVVTNLDEFIGIHIRRKARIRAAYISDMREIKLDENGIAALRRINGLKRCAPEHIKVYKREWKYGAEYDVYRRGESFVTISKSGIWRNN